MEKPGPIATPSASWQLRLPYAALALFLISLAALVWLTRVHDGEQQYNTLISDVLWMEQNLQFHLDRNAAQLAEIAPFLHDGVSAQAEAKLRHLLRPESGLVRVIWLDRSGQPIGAMPALSDDHLIGESRGAVPSRSTFRLALSVGRAVYGPAYQVAGTDHHFEAHVPIPSETATIAGMVGVYSLGNLIIRELPWWFSERYRVSIIDASGQEIAAKSKVAPLSDTLTYSIAFDPPGHGLILRIIAYKDEIRWIPALLIASILLLGGIIVWSIWQLRLQLARRQAAEQALRGEILFRKAMEESLMTGLRARDLDGRITYVNPAFCRMTGFSATELMDRLPPMPYWDPEHIDRTIEVHDLILSGNPPREGIELQLRRKDGQRLDAMIFEAPLIDAEGRHTGWMGSMMDVTEQRRARELAREQDERLQATSRLITMGEMASTLAHELNQPLAAISSYSSGSLNRLEDGDIDKQELVDIHRKIARQAQRAGEIIRRVHDFVRRSEPKREPLDLNAVILEALALIDPDVRKRGMRVISELAAGLPPVCADPLMIEQVIVNLLRNAMDAMRDTPRAQRRVTISTALENDFILVRVTDEGAGITDETARKLFEPFFTTKPEGMGMGLNICRTIAELHHGRLSYERRASGGTVFMLSLPV
jgi:two-component system sensor histidine kinase DctS